MRRRDAPLALVLRDAQRPTAAPVVDAMVNCFTRHGWRVEALYSVRGGFDPQIVAGWGWGSPIMRAARERWPDRILHADGGFWQRSTHYKVSLRDRWSPLADAEYNSDRLKALDVTVKPSREPGRRVLLCGMSAKACADWGIPFQSWERAAIARLNAAGAEIIYRPKPNAPNNGPLEGAGFDESAFVGPTLDRVDAVATHHSNCGVDALVAGLPIYTETGIAKPLSVATLDDLPGAAAPSIETRQWLLAQVAWHQWTVAEIAKGAWMYAPAPLAGDQIIRKVDVRQ